MAPKRRVANPDDQTRLQIICSKPQRAILEAAAENAATDLHTWAMAHMLAAAGRQTAENAPVILSGEVGDRLRQLAAKQGISSDALLEQMLIAGG